MLSARGRFWRHQHGTSNQSVLHQWVSKQDGWENKCRMQKVCGHQTNLMNPLNFVLEISFLLSFLSPVLSLFTPLFSLPYVPPCSLSPLSLSLTVSPSLLVYISSYCFSPPPVLCSSPSHSSRLSPLYSFLSLFFSDLPSLLFACLLSSVNCFVGMGWVT